MDNILVHFRLHAKNAERCSTGKCFVKRDFRQPCKLLCSIDRSPRRPPPPNNTFHFATARRASPPCPSRRSVRPRHLWSLRLDILSHMLRERTVESAASCSPWFKDKPEARTSTSRSSFADTTTFISLTFTFRRTTTASRQMRAIALSGATA